MAVIGCSNAAYGVNRSQREDIVYASVLPIDSTLPPDNKLKEEVLNQAADEISIKEMQGNCYAPVAILALVMAVFSLIVALVGVSYAPIELNNQQGKLHEQFQSGGGINSTIEHSTGCTI